MDLLKILVYLRGLIRSLKKVAPSEEVYRITRKAVLKYSSEGCVVLPVKQSQT